MGFFRRALACEAAYCLFSIKRCKVVSMLEKAIEARSNTGRSLLAGFSSNTLTGMSVSVVCYYIA